MSDKIDRLEALFGEPTRDPTLFGYPDKSGDQRATFLLQSLSSSERAAIVSLAERGFSSVMQFPAHIYGLVLLVDTVDPKRRNVGEQKTALEEIARARSWFSILQDHASIVFLKTEAEANLPDTYRRAWFMKNFTPPPAMHHYTHPPFELIEQHIQLPADQNSQFMQSKYALIGQTQLLVNSGVYS